MEIKEQLQSVLYEMQEYVNKEMNIAHSCLTENGSDPVLAAMHEGKSNAVNQYVEKLEKIIKSIQ